MVFSETDATLSTHSLSTGVFSQAAKDHKSISEDEDASYAGLLANLHYNDSEEELSSPSTIFLPSYAEEEDEEEFDEPGKTIVEDLGKYGRITTERVDTIAENREIQLRKRAYYRKQLADEINFPKGTSAVRQELRKLQGLSAQEILKATRSHNLPPKKRAEIRKLARNIVFAEEMLRAGRKHKESDPRPAWISTGAIRRKMADFGFKKTHEVPPCPVNLRVQKFEGSSARHDVDFVRLGGFSDPKYPGNSIEQLEQYLKRPNSKQLAQEINRRKNLIARYTKKGERRKAKAIEASLKPLLLIKEGHSAQVRSMLEQKKLFLDDLMLQYVTAQASLREESLQKADNGASFELFNISLLNEKKWSLDNTAGFIHDESVIMRDMSHTFEQFYGRSLIFDGQGPFIDRNGNIHSPQRHLDKNGGVKVLRLKPRFMNITVQKYTENGPIQRNINNKTLRSLLREVKDLKEEKEALIEELNQIKLKTRNRVKVKELEMEIKKLSKEKERLKEVQRTLLSVKKRLDSNKSNYKIASDLSTALLKLRKVRQGKSVLFGSSFNCYSGKDRTNVLCDAAINSTGLKESVRSLEEDPKVQRKVLSKLARRFFNKSSTGARVAQDNTGATAIKVSSLFLPTITDSIAGLVQRIFYYPKQMHAAFSVQAY